MKIITSSVINWSSHNDALQQRDSIIEWKKRIDKYLNHPYIFLTAGSYSDPKWNPTNLPLVQIDLPVTKPYSLGWSYWKHGFVTSLYSALLSNQPWDIYAYIHHQVLLGEDMIPKIRDFFDSSSLLMAAKFEWPWGTIVDTGCMFFKRDSLVKYITSQPRPILSDNNDVLIEQDIMDIFRNSWSEMYPEIPRFRSSLNASDGTEIEKEFFSKYHVSPDQMIKLPFFTKNHFNEEDRVLWERSNPIS